MNVTAPGVPVEARGFDRLIWSVPPPLLMLMGMISFQLGAAIAKDLFDQVSATGIAFMRVAFGSLFLFLITRPTVRGLNRAQWSLVSGMGGTTAIMGLLYFLALQRIPLGVATAIAFSGPFILAMSGAKRPSQLFWVVVAASGVMLLAPWGNSQVNASGFLLAAVAGLSYTGYVVITKRAGVAIPANDALPLAMAIAALLLTPVAIFSAGQDMLQRDVIVIVALTSILSNVLPYIFEFNALKRVSAALYAVLISLDPAVSALAGLLVLGERIGTLGYIAIGLICVGSMFANRAHSRANREAPGEA
jgi:inner membrane transporter RhtA